MVTTCGPNLTASKIRRVCGDCCMRRYRVDPAYGIPAGTPPICLDSGTNLVRAASSFVTAAAANAAFVGFCNETFNPGEDHLVWVYTCGWVEMELGTAAAVAVGDWFKLTASGGHVLDNIVIPENGELGDGIFEAVEACWCETAWTPRDNCPDDIGAEADTSPTPAPTDQMTQRTVILAFGDCYARAPYIYIPN